MTEDKKPILSTIPIQNLLWAFFILGVVTFVVLWVRHPERAWQVYLVNFLLFSAIAQGGLLFSTIMHTTRARWSGPLSNLAESFTAFFPVSFALFIILFLGREHLFPWLHQDLHGKEIWLNLPFLFSRDMIGLLILYGLGFAYLYHALFFKLKVSSASRGKARALLAGWLAKDTRDSDRMRRHMNVFSILYMLAFALVLSLIGFDLVMAADPHWYSTLFGAYCFVKAFYIGLGGLIIFASVLHLNPASGFTLKSSQFHDVGKLFLGFCLVWADFFYCQMVVIWYGNISEETHYVIARTMTPPWQGLAWLVFIVSFILPFLLLLNQKIKTKPKYMMALCSVVIVGIWLEHFLLIGPALSHGAKALTFGIPEFFVFLSFLTLMVWAVTYFLKQFPELFLVEKRGAN